MDRIDRRAARFFDWLGRLGRRLSDKSGYSLIELVVAIVMTGVAFPGIVNLYMNVSANSLQAEIMTMANMLAQEQIEIILADKAGSGAGFGYSAITSAKYASVNPAAPFTSFTRTVAVTTQNLAGSASYPAKVITVTVSHAMIPNVVLKTVILDHSSL